jgi:hypothetical protein
MVREAKKLRTSISRTLKQWQAGAPDLNEGHDGQEPEEALSRLDSAL